MGAANEALHGELEVEGPVMSMSFVWVDTALPLIRFPYKLGQQQYLFS